MILEANKPGLMEDALLAQVQMYSMQNGLMEDALIAQVLWPGAESRSKCGSATKREHWAPRKRNKKPCSRGTSCHLSFEDLQKKKTLIFMFALQMYFHLGLTESRCVISTA